MSLTSNVFLLVRWRRQLPGLFDQRKYIKLQMQCGNGLVLKKKKCTSENLSHPVKHRRRGSQMLVMTVACRLPNPFGNDGGVSDP